MGHGLACRMWIVTSLSALLLACCPCLAGEKSLEASLRPLISAHQGDVAVAVRNLKTGETFFHQADKPMPTASLIKLPVMIEVYFQVQEGKVRLEDRITLREADKVPGSGILRDHFSDGATFSLRDAVRLMIAFSDNTATNLVLDRIGIDSTARRMEALGYPNSKIHSKVFKRETSVFPERSKEFGLGSTTAREMVEVLQKLHAGSMVSPEASKAMLEHLRTCDDKDKFPRFLPPSAKLAHKSGSVSDARTDAGIFETPSGPVVLCVLTAKNVDQSWKPENAGNRLCAEVARTVHDHFAQKP